MSFLPYETGKSTRWFLPLTISLTAHGALIACLTTASISIFSKVPLDALDDLSVSLEILDLKGIEDAAPIAPEIADLDAQDSAQEPIEPLQPEALEPIDLAGNGAELEADGPEADQDEPTLEPLEPPVESAIEAPDLETPDLETTEAPAPEDNAPEQSPLEQSEPDQVLPEEGEAEVADVASTDDTAPILPDVISPTALPPAPTFAPVDSQIVSPLAERVGLGARGQSNDISLIAPDTVAQSFSAPQLTAPPPHAPSEQNAPLINLASLTPPAPATPTRSSRIGSALEDPSASAVLVAQLLGRIRAAQAPTCTIALPRRGLDGRVALSLIGAQREDMDRYAQTVIADLGQQVSPQFETVDARQCAALDAITITQAYPAARLGFQIENGALKSGEILNARILGAGGLNILALLIDDNGVVQDLSRFVTLEEDGTPQISVPVARSGGTRETRQVLMVLGAPDAPLDLQGMEGLLAQEVFDHLQRNTLTQSAFALATFDVR